MNHDRLGFVRRGGRAYNSRLLLSKRGFSGIRTGPSIVRRFDGEPNRDRECACMTDRPLRGIVKLRLTAVFDAQHGGLATS